MHGYYAQLCNIHVYQYPVQQSMQVYADDLLKPLKDGYRVVIDSASYFNAISAEVEQVPLSQIATSHI